MEQLSIFDMLYDNKGIYPQRKVKVLSLFSGIGAFEKAFDHLGIPYELVGYCEIDKYASKSYSAIHGVPESMNLGDITKVDEKALPKDIDLITYGFPCQDISLAGKQKGLFNEDGSKTRSGLFFEALRLIEETQPRVAIAENVKNLVGKKFNAQFQVVLASLEAAGYNNYYKVLNAKDYGTPQNRERVFIISIRKDIDNGMFQFPKPFPLEIRLKDVLEEAVDEKYYLDDVQIQKARINNADAIVYDKSMLGFETHAREYNDIMPTITAREWKEPRLVNEAQVRQIGNLMPSKTRENPNQGRLYDKEGLSPTLGAMQGGNRQPFITVEPKVIGGIGEKKSNGGKQWYQQDRIYDDEIAISVTTGFHPYYATTDLKRNGQGIIEMSVKPEIQRIDIPQTVMVRKYPVDCKLLCECLRDHKCDSNFSNKEIAEALNVPITKVEHWFRRDDCFAIPDAEIWMELKALLGIGTDEFDESIMTFEEKEGVYEKSERHYLSDGIAPTLTSATAAEKVIVPSLRIRKLTPKECFRLMGFDDEDYEKAEAVNSNTQLYKQAGNSIVVPVLEYIIEALFESGALQ